MEQLSRLGLLEESKRAEPAPTPRKVRGSLLYLRFAAFDPNRLLGWLTPKVRFFFTPSFLILSAALILSAFATTVLEWNEITRAVGNLWRFDALALAWFTVLSVTALHEFAHGVTCKHFGGEVHDMGFLLIYFQPAFYCNVSDAWLFPQKSRRLWVTFAGAYFEIFLWSLATLAWRLVEPGTWISFAALVVMATSAIKSLFNMNPLIKLDGYYLLSDYLEIPNLRQRAFGYLMARLRNFWRAPAGEAAKVSAREARIFLLYGLLAWVYSYWLLGYVALRFGSYLVTRYQVFGLILFVGLLMVVFRHRLTYMVSRITARSKTRPEEEPDGASVSPWSIVPARLRRPVILGACLAAFLAVLYFGRMQLMVSSEFKILPVTNAEVRAEIEGIIDQIYVDEGDVVKRGDPIARLADRDLRAELQMTEATIAEKTARLKMLEAGARPEEIDLARKAVETAKTRKEFALGRYEEAKKIRAEGLAKANANLAKAKERLKYGGSYLENARQLFTEMLISKQERDKAQEEVAVREKELEQADAEMKMILADDLAEVKRLLAVAEKELEEALGNLALLLAGSRPEEIQASRAEIANREAQRSHEREQIQLTKVFSPISGVITTPKLKERIGQLVPKGELIATVHELKTVTAEIVSPENEIADVKVGQKVTLKARAYPWERFEGKVTSIAPIATKEDQGPGGLGARNVLVSCRIDNPSLLLKSEMSGRAKIYCGQRRILDLITRRFARYMRVEFWSWW